LAGQSKIGCITQRRFAKAGTKTHSQRGAALDRNGLSVSTEPPAGLNRNRLSETPKFADRARIRIQARATRELNETKRPRRKAGRAPLLGGPDAILLSLGALQLRFHALYWAVCWNETKLIATRRECH